MALGENFTSLAADLSKKIHEIIVRSASAQITIADIMAARTATRLAALSISTIIFDLHDAHMTITFGHVFFAATFPMRFTAIARAGIGIEHSGANEISALKDFGAARGLGPLSLGNLLFSQNLFLSSNNGARTIQHKLRDHMPLLCGQFEPLYGSFRVPARRGVSRPHIAPARGDCLLPK